MTRTFRSVFYIPDHFEQPQRRLELGAFHRDDVGVIFSAEPGWEEIDLPVEDKAVIRLVMADLRHWRDFEALPVACGPHVVLGDIVKPWSTDLRAAKPGWEVEVDAVRVVDAGAFDITKQGSVIRCDQLSMLLEIKNDDGSVELWRAGYSDKWVRVRPPDSEAQP